MTCKEKQLGARVVKDLIASLKHNIILTTFSRLSNCWKTWRKMAARSDRRGFPIRGFPIIIRNYNYLPEDNRVVRVISDVTSDVTAKNLRPVHRGL